MMFLAYSPALWVGIVFLFALMIGSFLNVVIHRLPRMLETQWHDQCAELKGETPPTRPKYNLLVPASACPACGHAIAPRHNLPVVGWLWLRGRCHQCATPISARYPLVELLTAVLAATAAWRFGCGWPALAAIALICALVALAFIDLDTSLLPDNITQPLLWLGLLVNLDGLFVPLPDALVGAAAGYLVLWVVYWLFKLATGKEGMGYGDFKLLAALGAWLGWQQLPLIILASSLVGALAGIGLILFTRHDRRTPIPFGPYLAGGGVFALLAGPAILKLWLPSA